MLTLDAADFSNDLTFPPGNHVKFPSKWVSYQSNLTPRARFKYQSEICAYIRVHPGENRMTWEDERKTKHHKIPELDKTLRGIGFTALYKAWIPSTRFLSTRHKFSFQGFQRKGAFESLPFPQGSPFGFFIALLAGNFLIQSLHLWESWAWAKESWPGAWRLSNNFGWVIHFGRVIHSYGLHFFLSFVKWE